MRISEYSPARRAEVADLMERVWGRRRQESELEWLYEQNPVRPASVLLAEERGRVVASVAIGFLQLRVGSDVVEVGMPFGLATDPAYRGQGLFTRLQAANEGRARELGIRLLLVVPNAASASVFVERLGWVRLPSLRVWARARLLPCRVRAREVGRYEHVHEGAGDGRVVRNTAWMNWRFANAPRPYRLFEQGDGGYAVFGRLRRRAAFVAAHEGDLDASLGAVADRAVVATVPRPAARARLIAGWLPTPRTFTILGKTLDSAQPLPSRPRFELGDLDFL